MDNMLKFMLSQCVIAQWTDLEKLNCLITSLCFFIRILWLGIVLVPPINLKPAICIPTIFFQTHANNMGNSLSREMYSLSIMSFLSKHKTIVGIHYTVCNFPIYFATIVCIRNYLRANFSISDIQACPNQASNSGKVRLGRLYFQNKY